MILEVNSRDFGSQNAVFDVFASQNAMCLEVKMQVRCFIGVPSRSIKNAQTAFFALSEFRRSWYLNFADGEAFWRTPSELRCYNIRIGFSRFKTSGIHDIILVRLHGRDLIRIVRILLKKYGFFCCWKKTHFFYVQRVFHCPILSRPEAHPRHMYHWAGLARARNISDLN